MDTFPPFEKKKIRKRSFRLQDPLKNGLKLSHLPEGVPFFYGEISDFQEITDSAQ